MPKALIIAEKPSVASDIARALGGFIKKEDFFENDEYIVSSAVGHLLQIKAPDDYDVKRGKWSFAHLPVIPPYFELEPIAKNEARLKMLTKLIKRKDIDRLINACDAGREGELIFRMIVQHAKSKLPIQRLWLQSMTQKAIRESFTRLRSDEDVQPLAHAARCRSEADWLVGINGTRAMTAFNSKDGGFFLTTVGRVQTPTLSIVVEREEKIRKFVPRDYWEVHAQFACEAGLYTGRWFDPQFKKSEADAEQRDCRLWSQAAAESIVIACRNQTGNATEESKLSNQLPPLLFDLTSLQREANSRFGFSAKNTLAVAQALYEKHKVLTYPRTDSRALPEDYLGTSKDILKALQQDTLWQPFTETILTQEWVKPNRRIFDNSKVSDHFAIIPTLQTPGTLSEPELKLYQMVVRRFLAVFFPAAQYHITTRITKVQDYSFKTEGKVLTSAGWLQVYGRDKLQDDDDQLVALSVGERIQTQEIEFKGLTTKAPARYNEASLLGAMEGAGKRIEDDELRAAMAAKGLGTPATRAAIIEGLLTEKYIVREERELQPTAKAFQLMTLLRGLEVKELTAPELTGNWEFKLAQIEQGRLARDTFMKDIARMTEIIVKKAKEYNSDTIPGDYITLETPCPNCQSKVKENYRRFACTHCTFSITKAPAGRQFEIAEIETLLQNKQLGPLSGFRSKMGRPFAAQLKLSFDQDIQNFKLEFDFGQSHEEEDNQVFDFTGQEPVGACPKCQASVFEQGMHYICEHSVGPSKSCTFRSGTVVLQQVIDRVQMHKLLSTGRTDLLTGFKSARTGRSFKAFLVIKEEDHTTGFEFEKKDASIKKPTAKTATKTASKTTAKTTVKATAKTTAKATSKTTVKTAAKTTKTTATRTKKAATIA